jgi:hypothetical protein
MVNVYAHDCDAGLVRAVESYHLSSTELKRERWREASLDFQMRGTERLA